MFDVETNRFLTDLAANNTRDWFTENRTRYDAHFSAPAKAFLDVFSAEMQRHTGEPVDAKLFRVHRDVRFAKDKTPYNAHIHMAWHQTDAPLWWMVGLEPGKLTLGYGCFGFAKDMLEQWRRLIDSDAGAALDGILTAMTADGLRIGEASLKRVPAPYDKDHPRAGLLQHKEMAVWNDTLPLNAAYGDAAPAQLAGEMARFDPLHHWFQRFF